MSYVEVEYEMSERHACRLLGLGRSTDRYRTGKDRDAKLRMRLKELGCQAHAVWLVSTTCRAADDIKDLRSHA